jgi:hypothetical protein
MPYRNDDYDDLDDKEYPEPDTEPEGNGVSVPCPYCGHPIYEDAVQCPVCGSYISSEDSPSRKPWWIILGAFFLIITIIVFWIFEGTLWPVVFP